MSAVFARCESQATTTRAPMIACPTCVSSTPSFGAITAPMTTRIPTRIFVLVAIGVIGGRLPFLPEPAADEAEHVPAEERPEREEHGPVPVGFAHRSSLAAVVPAER